MEREEKEKPMKRIAIVCLMLVACAPDEAPYAPECTPEVCPDFFEDDPQPSCGDDAGVKPEAGVRAAVGEKHGAQGSATVHQKTATSTRALDIQWCGQWACHAWASPSYYYSEQVATCPTGRTCTLRDINFTFGWDGLDRWTQLPPTVQVCVDGLWCGDVTNAHSGLAGNLRYGSLTWFWGAQWSGNLTFRVWFQHPDWGVMPRYSPSGRVTSFRYTDGV